MRALIAEQCGVRYHAAHVWRILRQLGWSCQRPTGRALERDEEAIRYWKKVAWPRIKKKPACERRTLVFIDGERTERAAPSGAHLGAARADSGTAISFQLESALGRRRHHVLELLFPALPRSDSRCRRYGELPRPSAAAPARQAVGGLGRPAGPSWRACVGEIYPGVNGAG